MITTKINTAIHDQMACLTAFGMHHDGCFCCRQFYFVVVVFHFRGRCPKFKKGKNMPCPKGSNWTKNSFPLNG